ncbi:MAG: hypothetical protein GWM90_05775, partial [Gemmatimonadetes bacterium]|nr:S46 family peptidase [Gemmatimonadota bacterium]NIQ53279.1 S46 family peptidase [Gemmatimonadota bacterium]NIU73417.1 hypothetical protein [Gammaproteobacteria bacterium]NIX19481.1 hypothetical protein [Actinomycetota bacterium]NIX43643.1 hypothetical protein [Gemmatimonadota bacterium]
VLTRQTPYSPEVGARLLAIRLELARDWLPADDPVVRMAFRNPDEDALDAARRLVYGSRIADVGFRRDLLDSGRRAVTGSQDAM